MIKEYVDRAIKREQMAELAAIDIEIAHLEALLELRNEQRRELVNYLGLNKDSRKK
ncbi:MAG: hypothetical protein ACRCXB_07225 [Aeromonadaceae bacterium]